MTMVTSGVKGLFNLKNTCYLNAVLQCLAETPYLMGILQMKGASEVLNICSTVGGNLVGSGELSDAVMDCLVEMRSSCETYKPARLHKTIQTLVPDFRGYYQQDAHELLRHLLDSLNSVKLKVNADLELYPGKVFGGSLVSTRECQECLHFSESVESFLDLSLPVASETKEIESLSDDVVKVGCSVQTCLSEFCSIESLCENNKATCVQCTEMNGGKVARTNSTKQMLIGDLPLILILHLNRFEVQTDYTIKKISLHVEFPFQLNMSMYCKDVITGNTSLESVYNLYGVVEHRGVYGRGHYVAYVKTEEGRWFYTSDSYVEEVSEQKVLNAEAYILFYSLLRSP